jgi:hypothetical protein
MREKNTNKLKKRLRAMVPCTLPDLEKLFPKQVTRDRVYAVLQLLFFVRQRMLENEHYAPGIDRQSGYCPVNAKDTIKAIAGNGYRSIINKMVEYEIIQIKRNEETGVESFVRKKWTKLYRIHPKLRLKGPNGKRYRHEYITHPDVIRAVKRHYDKRFDRQLNEVEKKGTLYADIVRYGERFAVDIVRLEQDIQNGKLKDGDKLLERAHRFNEKLSRWCSHDNYGGRVNSHFVNLPKALRVYLVLRDAPDTSLTMVDVKSSQPYFLSLLFYKPELVQLVPEFFPIRNVLDKHTSDTNTKIFYDDCCDGVFYRNCMLMLGDGKRDADEFTDEEKEALKKILFHHIFYGSAGNYHKDDKKREERHRVETRFKLLYPMVYDTLMMLKRSRKEQLPFLHEYYRGKNKRTKMFTAPNCLATRVESKVLLDIIAATMFSLGVPVATIHDAFILETAHLDTLKQVFEQVFRQQLGVRPPKTETIMLTTMQQ